MFWEVERVGTPKKQATDEMPVSVWTGVEVFPGTQAEAGKHYVIDDVGLRDHPDYIVLPDIPAMQQMRHEWVLRRANRPYVPKPDSTPMPDNAASQEDKARLYSVYLRPWVLDQAIASAAVPHITDLNKCEESSAGARTAGGENTDVITRRRITGKTPGAIERSFARAWQHYIRHRIVSVHAKRIISQFMAACCGKSTTEDVVENQPGTMPTEMEKSESCSFSLQYDACQYQPCPPRQKKTNRHHLHVFVFFNSFFILMQCWCFARLGFVDVNWCFFCDLILFL